MKYALDVLDNYVEDPRCETERVAAVNLLRQAIAEAEKTIYVDSSRFPKDQLDHKPGMVITAPVQAIAEDKWEPKIYRCYSPNGDLISITIKRTPDGEREQIHPPKRDNLSSVEQPDLARVGEVGVWGDKREWVGLTDEDRKSFYKGRYVISDDELMDAVEAKLKEKNT
jgi:hypothetical protein